VGQVRARRLVDRRARVPLRSTVRLELVDPGDRVGGGDPDPPGAHRDRRVDDRRRVAGDRRHGAPHAAAGRDLQGEVAGVQAGRLATGTGVPDGVTGSSCYRKSPNIRCTEETRAAGWRSAHGRAADRRSGCRGGWRSRPRSANRPSCPATGRPVPHPRLGRAGAGRAGVVHDPSGPNTGCGDAGRLSSVHPDWSQCPNGRCSASRCRAVM
jgi:hypothetical protein